MGLSFLMMRLFKVNSSLLTFIVALLLLVARCNSNFQTKANPNGEQNMDNAIAETTDNSFCPVLGSRNWHAWIDRVAEHEPRLNIWGEVDFPTAGYQVAVKPGILDRRQPPA